MDSCLTAEISADALRSNIRLLRQRLAASTRLCAVVKCDCYGHGLSACIDAIAPLADALGVATAEEAMQLRDLGQRLPILVFFTPGMMADRLALLADLVARDVTLTVAAGDEAGIAGEAARRAGKGAQVHLKIDTGMNRSGVAAESAPAVAERIREHPGLRLTGAYTHFASADDADKTATLEQLDRFLTAAGRCGRREDLVLHAANSAALIDLPRTHLDMVRPGIAVYGYHPSEGMRHRLPLRGAMRLVAPLMQIKDVPAGARSGYGLTYAFDRPSRIGLAAVGYGDGYLRCLSNRAVVGVAGGLAPVRGRVSMDQIVIDLTDLPAARVGDPVEIISPDPSAPHSVENLARLAGTIPYEITCRIGQRARRVSVGD